MKWALVMLFMQQTPIETGLTFDTVSACYKAEDTIAQQETDYFNGWIRWAEQNPKESTYPPVPSFISNRIMRGVCVPRQTS